MALDKDIVGSTEFLEAVGLQGSTYLLEGPNGENVELNQSEINDDGELEVGEEYSFFTYPNRSGELFTTQNMPDVMKDKYSFAKVLKTDRDGTHIDAGLPREVLVPWGNLSKMKSLWPQPGDRLLVTLRIDRENHIHGRLASKSIIENMFTLVRNNNSKNEVIRAKPYRALRTGSFLLSESGYEIFVHESERRTEPRLSESVQVGIVGHNDKGELNGSFLPPAHERLGDDSQIIFDLLIGYDGELPLWDKSSPEVIREIFNTSKGPFKRAIGHLYKQKIINIETGKITLTREG